MLIKVNFFAVNMHCLKDNTTSSLLNNFIFSFLAEANKDKTVPTQPPIDPRNFSQGTLSK